MTEYAERMKNTQEEIFTFYNAWEFKGTSVEKIEWGVKYWPRMNTEQFANLIFGYQTTESGNFLHKQYEEQRLPTINNNAKRAQLLPLELKFVKHLDTELT
jgi:hypothetical protein